MNILKLIEYNSTKVTFILASWGYYFLCPYIVELFHITSSYDKHILGIDIFYGSVQSLIKRILQQPDKSYLVLEYLSFCYISLIIFSYVNLVIAWRDHYYWLGNLLLCLTLGLFYIFIPTTGPYFLQYKDVIKLQEFPMISQLNFRFIELLSNKVDAFPSAHTASAIFIMNWYWQKDHYLKTLILIFGISVIISTIILGQHYIIDVLVGSVLGIGSLRCATYLIDNKMLLPQKPSVKELKA